MSTTNQQAVSGCLPVAHIVSGDLWGGAEAQIVHMARVLSAIPGIDPHFVVLNPGLLARRLEEVPVDVRTLDEGRTGFWGLYRQIRQILERIRPRIVHTHRYKENVLGALASRGLPRCALIQTVHGWTESYRGLRRWKFLGYDAVNTSITRRLFHRVAAVSEEIRQHLAELYPTEQLAIVRNAIDIEAVRSQAAQRDRVRREFGIHPASLLVGTAGRMVPVKDFDLFLAMATRLHERFPAATFMIVGDGPLRFHLESVAAHSGLGTVVRFTGFREDAVALMSGFDVFVLSSRHEGIPLALLEAMALGLAAVVPSVGGLPEVVRHPDNGLLVPPGSAEELAAACGLLLSDEPLRQRIGAQAAQSVEAEFSLRRLQESLLSLYGECLAFTERTPRSTIAPSD